MLDSESLRWVDYDAASSTLRVEFRANGGVYDDLGVPRAAYRRLMRAESRGEWFNHNIRDQYLTVKVRAPSSRSPRPPGGGRPPSAA